MQTLGKPFTGAEAKKRLHFSCGGVAGARRLPFPFGALLNRALMFISSFIKEPGRGGRGRRMERPDHLYPQVCEVGGLRGCVHVEARKKSRRN